jgi:predicted dehydrogenase
MSGVHRIDLLRFIMDAEVDEVSAFVDTRTEGRLFDDSVTAMLRFDNGVVATIRFAIEAARAGDPVAVYCSEGSITTIETTSQWWVRAGGKVAVLSQGKESLKEFEITDLYLEQVESFKRAINGEESQIATGEDGLRAVEIASAIYDSARRRQVVRVGRQES